MNYWNQSNQNIYVAAHRGFSSQYPENTLAAFKAAIDLDVDQIETDIRITKDNELVLIHDAALDRTTNGSGKVCDYTLAELKQFNAGNGEHIPTLREFLELVKDHPTITVDIELKEYPVKGWENVAYNTCDKTLEMLEEYGFTERCVINSFSGKLNEYVYQKYNGNYKQHMFYPPKIMHLEGCSLQLYSFGYCACFIGDFSAEIPYEEIKQFQQDTGIRIWAPASVKDERTVDMAVKMGAELITCNNPDEILRILRNKGLHK